MAKAQESDEELAARASRGDQTAFGGLVDRYGLRLLRLLILTCGLGPDDAEDVAQDVWLKASRTLPKRQPGPFHSWLFTIARNAAIDLRRKNMRIPTQNDPDGNILSLATASDPAPDRVAAGRDEAQKLAGCLEKLKLEFRAVVVGFAAGEQYHELAARLVIPIDTVKSRLFRARDALKKCLGESAT